MENIYDYTNKENLHNNKINNQESGTDTYFKHILPADKKIRNSIHMIYKTRFIVQPYFLSPWKHNTKLSHTHHSLLKRFIYVQQIQIIGLRCNTAHMYPI